MKKCTGFSPLASLLLLLPGLAWAHGDVDKPLFVSAGGEDTGRCKDPATPCRSIAYALKHAGKGGQVRIATGTYSIESAEDLFHIVSGTIDVVGGYREDGRFVSSAGGQSTLTGVPPEYRPLLEGRGFHIIADTKGHNPQRRAQAEKLLAMNEQLKSSMPATPCSGSSVNGLACSDVDLLSHMAFNDFSGAPSASADVWGFVDLNTHREYAIVGFNNGTAVVDVTDPEAPVEVGYVFGQNTTWRDIKIYQSFDTTANRWQSYAYVTTDGASDGLFVLDLSGLPHSIRRTSFLSDFSSAHNVYAANTDYATGVSLTGAAPTLIIAGSNLSNGGYRSYSLANAPSPQFAGSASGAGYMHDASSTLIADSRKQTQCGVSGDFCEVLFDFNENALEIWNITSVSNPVLLGTTSYANASYVHSGWWSEDQQYLFLHDELDEQRFGLQTTLRIFSVADLRNPTLAGTWSGPTTAIDHNGFVRGNRYYMSNYSRGLTVLDISNPAAPVEVGLLDTYPFSDTSSFVGAWGAYPFFHSGTVAISDISSGLYLADDRSRQVAQGTFRFSDNSYAITEGGSAAVSVERADGSAGNVSVNFQLVATTASNDDVAAVSQTLSWADGETGPKTITVSAVNDGVAEPLEHMLARLVAPEGGATLANANTTSLYIGDPGASATVDLLDSIIIVAEQGFAKAVVTVQRGGSASGAVSVNIDMTGGDADPATDIQGATSAVLSWADGDAIPKSIEIDIVDDGVSENEETIELTLSNAVGATIGASDRVVISIGNGSGLNRAPNAVAGGAQSIVEGSQVTLDGSQSSDPDGDTLTYLWTQTLGPNVTLNGADTATASFTAPAVTSDAVLQFSLDVSDSLGQSDSASTSVTVRDSSTTVTPSGSSGGGALNPLLLAILLCGVFRRRWSVRQTDGA